MTRVKLFRTAAALLAGAVALPALAQIPLPPPPPFPSLEVRIVAAGPEPCGAVSRKTRGVSPEARKSWARLPTVNARTWVRSA